MSNTNNNEIDNYASDTGNTVDPMTFMTEEEATEENKKAESFIKAFRFGTPEFFRKIKEVYELEGIRGLKRLELSLDTYMNIRGMVLNEVIESNPDVINDEKSNEEAIVFE